MHHSSRFFGFLWSANNLAANAFIFGNIEKSEVDGVWHTRHLLIWNAEVEKSSLIFYFNELVPIETYLRFKPHELSVSFCQRQIIKQTNLNRLNDNNRVKFELFNLNSANFGYFPMIFNQI